MVAVETKGVPLESESIVSWTLYKNQPATISVWSDYDYLNLVVVPTSVKGTGCLTYNLGGGGALSDWIIAIIVAGVVIPLLIFFLCILACCGCCCFAGG